MTQQKCLIEKYFLSSSFLAGRGGKKMSAVSANAEKAAATKYTHLIFPKQLFPHN